MREVQPVGATNGVLREHLRGESNLPAPTHVPSVSLTERNDVRGVAEERRQRALDESRNVRDAAHPVALDDSQSRPPDGGGALAGLHRHLDGNAHDTPITRLR